MTKSTSRGFMIKTVITLVVMAFCFMAPVSQAQAGEKELTVLVWSHFIPDVDKQLKKHAQEFAKLKGIKVRVDTIDHHQFAAKKASEAQAHSGHDIIQNYGADALIYNSVLEPCDGLINELSKTYGGYTDLAAQTCKVNGVWKSVPWYYYPYPLVIRMDLVKEIGEKAPTTWEDVLKIATKLKAKGKPAGFQLGHSRDGGAAMRCILWAYGASLFKADGKTVAINSPETLKAIDFVTKLYKNGMSPAVISWDDGANNRAFLAGQCSMTFNSPSIYKKAKGKNFKVLETDKPLAEAIDHILPPKGPKGRYAFADALSLGIWNFSKNKELAKEFLKYHFAKNQFDAFLDAAVGYNVPFLLDYRKHAVFTSDPKVRFVEEIAKFEHTLGYPGPVTAASQSVWDLYILNNMFAYAATGKKSPQEAMEWAEKEVKAVLAGENK